MKRLGLIGGVGPESTIVYYRKIIQQVQEQLKTPDLPEILMHSINMNEMLYYVAGGKLDALVEFLHERVQVLEQAGAEFIAIASNTPHIVFDELKHRVQIPMISIIEETCKALQKEHMRKVFLMGTKSTMTKGFYQRKAAEFGVEICLPTEEELNFIHTKYMTELVPNTIKEATKKDLLTIVNKMRKNISMDGVILGGTEFSLMFTKNDFDDLHVFDSTLIHIKCIVQQITD